MSPVEEGASVKGQFPGTGWRDLKVQLPDRIQCNPLPKDSKPISLILAVVPESSQKCSRDHAWPAGGVFVRCSSRFR